MERDVIARLAGHRALGHAPSSEHAWLAAHGTLRRYEAGEVVNGKGNQAIKLQIIFEGRIVIRMDRGAGSHKIFEWRGGDVSGALPYSRAAKPPADAIAEEATEALEINKELLPDLAQQCPVCTETLVHIMVDRARHFTSTEIRDEKLISLGKLAAGLAHELNNPASALIRSAKLLIEALAADSTAARELIAAGLTSSQLASIEATRRMCEASQGAVLSSLDRADREDEIAAWLSDHGASEECAVALADSGVTLTVLDALATEVSGNALESALRWLAATCLARSLSSEIESASTRIHALVAAVKGFSYMDRAPSPEPVDIRRGITDTFTMLAAKTRAKQVKISIILPDDLPRAHAVGAEINQVWMNLIDNAIDAVGVGGHVSVSAARELDCVVVRIVDDGHGIPADIQSRIFDPFFTTKGVGQGTGLGLDVVRRLLQRHDGEVAVESVPGRTEFQVRLPVG